MAAGQGFKTFNTGDVLTSSDTNGYLMQGVWVFASSAARSAAVTSPQEGNASFLKDTNSLEIYDGATWVSYGGGDITGVTAGTGISGGGTSGDVTITNSMATAIDAKGDLIVGTAADTFDRLAVGTNGQALLADSTTATGLKWGSSTPSYTKTDFTPVVGQSNAVTIASSTCWYIAIDKLVFVQFAINIGGSGTSNNYITLSLPNGTNTFAANEIIGQVRFYRASTATNYYGFVMGDGANVAFVSGLNKTNSTSTFWGGSSSDYAFALANNDAIQGSFWYRKA